MVSSPGSQASQWQGDFGLRSPLFSPLESVASCFRQFEDWPDMDDIRAVFRDLDAPVFPVPQAASPSCFEDSYEPRIFLKGELQTRLANWHDFFNALVWLRFPKTKSVLNRQHFLAARQRQGKSNRSPLENALTRFDECGALLISSRSDLLEMVRDHAWKRLFWANRDSLVQDLRCVVFGHAMFEKALTPYLGMTTNTLLVHSSRLVTADLRSIDSHLADHWGDSTDIPRLHPFPVLGLPGWHADNHRESFYDNRQYFRPKRTG